MLIVQKFHSIHEIDPEFVSDLELLLQDEVPGYYSLVERHDRAPATDLFTYFLFFAPVQNAPIGLAQVRLRHIDSDPFLPWWVKLWRKICFWVKDREHWKEVSWQVGDGSGGLCVFDSRYARTGKEKVQELLKEYEARNDCMAIEYFSVKGLQDVKTSLDQNLKLTRETYVLEALPKAHKTYQDYLSSLPKDVQREVKGNWKKLHDAGEVKLGDYASALETPKTFPVSEDTLNQWEKWGASVLTFEKDLKVLGCILVLTGKNGNVFFEPIPFEPQDQAIVTDEVYVQYALLKFFELPAARRCHLLKDGNKFTFDHRDDLRFFLEQGFTAKTIVHQFYSKLEGLERPL